jgi:DNA-binding CsgD family transcriptional regulator
MVVADDERRYVAANPASCLLLRMREEDVLMLRIDDVTPAENRPQIKQLWQAFMREGVQHGTFELMMPDGARLKVDYSATANVQPGRHLSILMFPPSDGPALPTQTTTRRGLLTTREREVLGMVAMGRGSSWIAAELQISASTVETHVRNCLQKLGARNRAHAIALAVQDGEIELHLDLTNPQFWG